MDVLCNNHQAIEVEIQNLNRRMERVEEVADIVIELKTIVASLDKTLNKVNDNMTNINTQLIKLSSASESHNTRLEKLETATNKIIENDTISVVKTIKDILIKTVLPAVVAYLLAKNGLI